MVFYPSVLILCEIILTINSFYIKLYGTLKHGNENSIVEFQFSCFKEINNYG